jgi:D-methionine transport system ATP-binding protein
MKSRTVFSNVAFPLKHSGLSKEEIAKKVRELLALVEIEDKEKVYPSQLSGGQKQRVAIARALANNPDILLCDEATSALDPQTTTSIINLLREINEKLGITIVIITHQMSVITDVCQKVAIIDSGKLVESGIVEDIFAKPKSDAAKELISGKDIRYIPVKTLEADKTIRIVFKENSAYEPVLANAILKLGQPINILKADTKNVGGKAVGEMILGLPEDEEVASRLIAYLKEVGLVVTDGVKGGEIA